jgi:hypothetical protein
MSQLPNPTPIQPNASPAAYQQVPANAGVWRDGSTIILYKGSLLPHACVKCSREASQNVLRKTYSWHHPALYILIISPLIYIIVALIVRKTALVHVPLCEAHRSRRRNFMLIASAAFVAGLGCFFIPGALNEVWPILLGILLFLGGAITGIVGTQILTPKKIDDQYAWLNGAGTAYLNQLPPLPPPQYPQAMYAQ